MTSKKEYKKLPGKKRNFFGIHTLWIGPDHLLSIDSSIYTERYKRFYYKDIQALTLCKIDKWKIITILLISLSLLLLWLSFYLGVAGSYFSRFMSAVFFISFLVYFFWGPSFECYLKTAIQTEKLPSLYRYRAFKKTLALVAPKIESAQRNLEPDPLAGSSSSPIHPSPASESQKPPSDSFTPTTKHENGFFHRWMFSIFLLFGILLSLNITFTSTIIIGVASVISIGLAVLVILSLIRQSGSDLSPFIRTLSWISLLYVCGNFLVLYIIYLVTFFGHIRNADSAKAMNLIETLSAYSTLNHPLWLGYHIASIIICLGFGTMGLIAVHRFQTDRSPFSPISPKPMNG